MEEVIGTEENIGMIVYRKSFGQPKLKLKMEIYFKNENKYLFEIILSKGGLYFRGRS